MKTYIFKEGRNNYHRVKLSDIIFIKADKGRTVITCTTLEINSPLHFNVVLNTLNDSLFQCHRSFAVNLDKISKFNTDTIYLSKHSVSLGTKYKTALFERMLTKPNYITN